ncbi:SHOCT domain-containing protein [Amycolatopsis suaedae]|uniref:SHOCT domain-containing protein n=1 Tax=Amycolatopsis suaedae TaxID=2510978 RepID=A0A4V2EMQ5_9PSEU|nr:SHOCT domain-containing protein [Amycolatopsis suaedae]RZQ65925.1 SHOCT domain-containing protein [Amycolatopsis suaedae]
MPHWFYDGGGWLGGLFMLISMVLLWGGLITVLVVVFRRYGPARHSQGNALRLLDERYARGDIDQEEYERRRSTLARS